VLDYRSSWDPVGLYCPWHRDGGQPDGPSHQCFVGRGGFFPCFELGQWVFCSSAVVNRQSVLSKDLVRVH
jgi:hypothetical protein